MTKLGDLGMLDFISVNILLIITSITGSFVIDLIKSINHNIIKPLLELVVPDTWFDSLKIKINKKNNVKVINLGKLLIDMTMVIFALLAIYMIYRIFYKKNMPLPKL